MASSLATLCTTLFNSNNDWRQRLLREWPIIVGILHTRMRLEKIVKDTLIIGVYEVHWMQELYMLSSMIIDTINNKLGESCIAKLHFRLVEKKELVTKTNKTQVDRAIKQRPLAVAQVECLQRLKDQQLRELLIQLWHRCTP